MTKITLDQASTIVDAALATATQMKLKPMSVAVLDDGGHLVVFKKQDNSSLLRFDIAYGKAWGALGLGRSSAQIAKLAKDLPEFVAAATAASGGRIIPVQGGLLVRDAAGNLLGAVGVSGDSAQNDEACAVAGVKAAGLHAEP
ncbi:MAG: GlcG/HbpS family heme-binding protein [Gemmatimonas sp.]